MQNQVAIITGAGRGIGKAIAINLAKSGYDLLLSSRNKEQLEQVADECEKYQAQVYTHSTNLRSEKGILQLFNVAIAKFAKIDILINNAAIGVFKPFNETFTDEWDKVISTNLTGAFICCREAMKTMMAQKSGTIDLVHLRRFTSGSF